MQRIHILIERELARNRTQEAKELLYKTAQILNNNFSQIYRLLQNLKNVKN